MKELYKLLKDHKNPFMQDLVTFSYQYFYAKEAQDILDDSLSPSQMEFDCGTENVVRIKCVLPSYQPCLSNAIGKLMEAKLKLDVLGISTSSTVHATQPNCDPLQAERRLSDKLTVLINDIDIAMKNLNYGLYRGKVYRKINQAKYTFAFKCEPRAFINSLAANEFYKARLLVNMRKVIDLMSDPYCEVICSLTVDYDLIEVNDGMCWSIRERKFIECPIPESKIGKISPRAFCQYDSTKQPEPKYFQQILENSLDAQEQANFCEDFLKLLNYNRKQHKDKVPCLVGESNSGKSSLFFPILGIVHHSNIATITKQRAFNKAMITKFTEVIFMDEATESALTIDDWKTLTQGGFAAFDVKYSTARAFINRCPMLITSQKKLNFGSSEDQKAMNKRLHTYKFKSLPHPKKRAANWLTQNPMDCIVWASMKAALFHDDEGNSSCDEDLGTVEEEGQLEENEKEALRSFSPVESANLRSDDFNNDESNVQLLHEESETDERILSVQTVLQNTTKDTLRYRQAHELLAKEKERVKENQRHYEMKKDRYKNLGVSTQNLELVPEGNEEPDPTPIALERDAFTKAQEFTNMKARQQKCQTIFQDAWLRNAEQKLHDCVIIVNETNDNGTRSGAQGMIEIYSNRLKLHHQTMGTWAWSETLDERRRCCIALGLLDKNDQHLVNALNQPLPYKSRRMPKIIEQEDDGDIFLTPLPSRTSQRCQSPAPKRKCKNHDSPTKKHKSILSYFTKYFN